MPTGDIIFDGKGMCGETVRLIAVHWTSTANAAITPYVHSTAQRLL